MRSITRNCKISYSAPTASEQDQQKQQLLCVARWTVLLIATHCGYDTMKGTPTHDTWLKVIVSTQKHPHTFQEGSYSKKSAWNNKTYLSSNLQFCGCTMLNTFAPLKNQTSWEWRLLTTLIINFQVKTTFTLHLDTSRSRAKDYVKHFFWIRWLLTAILMRRHPWQSISLSVAKGWLQSAGLGLHFLELLFFCSILSSPLPLFFVAVI